MNNFKRAIMQELQFTFVDCDDNLDMVLQKYDGLITKKEVEVNQKEIFNKVADNICEAMFNVFDDMALDEVEKAIDEYLSVKNI